MLFKVLLGLLVAALCYAAAASFLFWRQRAMLYPGRQCQQPVQLEPGRVEMHWLEAPGARVQLYYLPPQRSEGTPPGAGLIFAHGNAECAAQWIEHFQLLSQGGVGVLLFEYPGYGESTGQADEKTIADLWNLAFGWLAARPEIQSESIVAAGRSLGGAVATSIVGRRNPAALVLMSSFSTTRIFARRYWMPPWLVLDNWDTARRLRDWKGPLLIVHGTEDRLVPYGQAELLVASAPQAQIWAYEGGDHNNVPPDWPEFMERLYAWMRQQELIPRGTGI